MHYRPLCLRLLLLKGFVLALSTGATGGLYADSSSKLSGNDQPATSLFSDNYYEKANSCNKHCEKPACQDDKCKKGDKGDKGDRGNRGRRGQDGCTGCPGTDQLLPQISRAIDVTSDFEQFLPANSLVSFSSPILTPDNGVNTPSVNGMTLVESIPASGNFDTILLPAEEAPTIYLVTFGLTVGGAISEFNFAGQFQLLLNGVPLPYTTISILDSNFFVDNTAIVINPASALPGTLSIVSLLENTPLQPNPGFSATMSVVKLNNNHN